MKNTLTYAGVLLVTVITIVTACKKDDGKKLTAYDKKVALIYNRNWNIVFAGYDYNNDGVLNYDIEAAEGIENAIAHCMVDDEYEFRKDSTFYMRMLGENNGCGDVDGGPFPWYLSADCKTFNYAGENWDIVTLNDSVFLFKKKNEDNEVMYTEFRR
ncbi:hypothetical protein MKQ70_16750 [Chitinophaga sedimenti]|uniref:hypothetical protein n=1 Tax=Chitinophaga sedimenti TaxID=2033606 RepID=UPI0020052154|nr:hypothetical protein [Chitinophaga sedimenti]MCK7556576.1 hypothetical protein [Chitinophaga sedimenti]